MKKEQGFSLVISLIFMMILTFIGFGIANRGLLIAQVAQTSSRYSAVSAAAEDEMYRLMRMIVASEEYIPTGNGVRIADTNGDGQSEITQVWDSDILANAFGTTLQPIFSNFSNAGWSQALVNDVASEYDTATAPPSPPTINTQSFIQEMVLREVDSNTKMIEVQYLVTVKAAARNPGDSNSRERESIVLQSVYARQFIL